MTRPVSFNEKEPVQFNQINGILRNYDEKSTQLSSPSNKLSSPTNKLGSPNSKLSTANKTKLTTQVNALRSNEAKEAKVSINSIFSDGPYQGASVLSLLASNDLGLSYIKGEANGSEEKSDNFESDITAESLNALVSDGDNKGYSALLGFCSSPTGIAMLKRSEYLRSLIQEQALNARLADRSSALGLLLQSEEGRSILTMGPALIEKISEVGVAANADFLLGTSEGHAFLKAHPALIEKISKGSLNRNLEKLVDVPNGIAFLRKTPKLLGFISAEGLNSVLEELVDEAEGLALLNENPALVEMIDGDDLSDLDDEDDSIARCILSHKQGIKLFIDHPALINKVTQAAMITRNKAGFSPLSLLAANPAFHGILNTYEGRNQGLIAPASLHEPARFGSTVFQNLCGNAVGHAFLASLATLTDSQYRAQDIGQSISQINADGESHFAQLKTTEAGQKALRKILLEGVAPFVWQQATSKALPEVKADSQIDALLVEERCFREPKWGFAAVQIAELLKAQQTRMGRIPVVADCIATAITATQNELGNSSNDPAVTEAFNDALYDLVMVTPQDVSRSFINTMNKRFSGAKLLANWLTARHAPGRYAASYDYSYIFDDGNTLFNLRDLLRYPGSFKDKQMAFLAVSLYNFARMQLDTMGLKADSANGQVLKGVLMEFMAVLNSASPDYTRFGASLIQCFATFPDSLLPELREPLRDLLITSSLQKLRSLIYYAADLLAKLADPTLLADKSLDLLLQQRCFTDPVYAQATLAACDYAINERMSLAAKPDAAKSAALDEVMNAAILAATTPNKANHKQLETTLAKCYDNSSLSMKLLGALMIIAGLIAAGLGIAGTYATAGLSTKAGCIAGTALVTCGATMFYKGMSDHAPEPMRDLQAITAPTA